MIKREGYYELIDSSNSHNQLLFRKTITSNEGVISNEDLIFIGVRFMYIPFELNGFEIKQIEHSNNNPLAEVFERYLDQSPKIVQIISDQNDYYVLADRVQIQTNNLKLDEPGLPIKREPKLTIEEQIEDIKSLSKLSDEDLQALANKGDWETIV